MKNINRLSAIVQRSLFRGGLDYDRTISALIRLSDLVNDADEVDWSDDLDSLLVGAYWFCSDYHSGQHSDEYLLSSNIGRYFDPGMSTLDQDSMEYEVYQALASLE